MRLLAILLALPLLLAGCQTTDTWTEDRPITAAEAMLKVPLTAKQLDIYDVEITRSRDRSDATRSELWEWAEGAVVVNVAGPNRYYRARMADEGDFRFRFGEVFGEGVDIVAAAARRDNAIGRYFVAEARTREEGAPCLAFGQTLPIAASQFEGRVRGSRGVLLGVACRFDRGARVRDVEQDYLSILDGLDLRA